MAKFATITAKFATYNQICYNHKFTTKYATITTKFAM